MTIFPPTYQKPHSFLSVHFSCPGLSRLQYVPVCYRCRYVCVRPREYSSLHNPRTLRATDRRWQVNIVKERSQESGVARERSLLEKMAKTNKAKQPRQQLGKERSETRQERRARLQSESEARQVRHSYCANSQVKCICFCLLTAP